MYIHMCGCVILWICAICWHTAMPCMHRSVTSYFFRACYVVARVGSHEAASWDYPESAELMSHL